MSQFNLKLLDEVSSVDVKDTGSVTLESEVQYSASNVTLLGLITKVPSPN